MTERLVIALVAALLAWLEARLAKPKTISNAQTPEDVRRAWADYLRLRLADRLGRLRDPDGDH
jgi:hypothetical protein